MYLYFSLVFFDPICLGVLEVCMSYFEICKELFHFSNSMYCVVDLFSLIGSCSVMFLTTVFFGEVKGARKVSLLIIRQQARINAYLCLLHLTTCILVNKVSMNLPFIWNCVLVLVSMFYLFLGHKTIPRTIFKLMATP